MLYFTRTVNTVGNLWVQPENTWWKHLLSRKSTQDMPANCRSNKPQGQHRNRNKVLLTKFLSLSAKEVVVPETEILPFWWNFHYWLQCKLSFWQLPVLPMMEISSKWHFQFSICVSSYNLASAVWVPIHQHVDRSCITYAIALIHKTCGYTSQFDGSM